MGKISNVIIERGGGVVIPKKPTARLTWTTCDGFQEKLLTADEVVTIGRGDNNTIVLNSPKVSRNHARIEWSGEHFVVHDLGSSNGTFVNGKRVDNMPLILKDGDEVRFERQPFKFESSAIEHNIQDSFDKSTIPALKNRSSLGQVYLEVIAGPECGKIYPLSGESITIGRISKQANWEVCIDDGTVSRPHASIEKRGSCYFLIDLGSANGTTLNGLFVIEPVLIDNGDVIGVGESQMVFRMLKI